jgi:hypothetical protein
VPDRRDPIAGIAVDPRALRDLLRVRGGFTLDHDSGRPLSSGIAVCADPELAWSFPFRSWDEPQVIRWLATQRPRLAEGDVHVGGWLEDEGLAWLELVWVLPERLGPAALTLGKLHGQHAVFDLRRRRLIVVDHADASTGST